MSKKFFLFATLRTCSSYLVLMVGIAGVHVAKSGFSIDNIIYVFSI